MCFFLVKRATVPHCLRSSHLMMVAQHILHLVADHRLLSPGWKQKRQYGHTQLGRKAKLPWQNKGGVAARGHCDPPATHWRCDMPRGGDCCRSWTPTWWWLKLQLAQWGMNHLDTETSFSGWTSKKNMFQQLTTLQSYNFREKETHQAGTFTKIIPTPVAQPESNEPLASDHRDSYWAVPQTTPQHSTCWTLHWGDAARESGPFLPFRLHRGRPWTSRNSGLFGWWPRSFDLPFWRNITNNMPTSFGKEMRPM